MRPNDPATWRPGCLDVEVTSACNVGCRYCYLGRPRGDFMSRETADVVVRYLNAHNTPLVPAELNLYGGEPFLNFEIVQHLVASSNARATIFTNGASAEPWQIAWCIANGVRPKRSTAGCPEAAELTRPGGYTERWLAEGELWQDHADARRLTVTPETAPCVRQSVLWLRGKGYKGSVDLATDDYAAWPTGAQEAYSDQLALLAKDCLDEVRAGRPVWVENFSSFGRAIFAQSRVTIFGCGAGWNTWGVTWDGRIVPCHRFFREPGGSPFGGGALKMVLPGGVPRFGEVVVKAVDGWARGVERVECLACSARQCCSRGCLHVQRAAGGMPDHRCRFTRLYAGLARWINDESRIPRWWDAN